jgi:glycosyltransferase involved in cell wall biosynthesis
MVRAKILPPIQDSCGLSENICMPSCSVVIPLYNKAPHIAQTLKSVFDQTYPADEILVVDDGSTDGSGEIVKNLNHPRVRLITQPNQGEGAARNRGIREAKGELIGLLDADDVWKPRFLEAIVKMRQQFPQAGAYATFFDLIKPTGVRQKSTYNCLPSGCQEGLIHNFFKIGLYFPLNSSCIAIPKKVFQEIGGFQEGEALGADVDMWLRIAVRYPIAWSCEHLAEYHQTAVNRAAGFKKWAQEPAVSRSARQALEQGLVAPEIMADFKEYAAHFQVQAVVHAIQHANKQMAWQLLAYSKGTKKYNFLWWQCLILNLLPGKAGSLILRCKKFLIEQ